MNQNKTIAFWQTIQNLMKGNSSPEKHPASSSSEETFADFSDPFDGIDDPSPVKASPPVFVASPSAKGKNIKEHPFHAQYTGLSGEDASRLTFSNFMDIFVVEAMLRRLAQLPEREFLILRGSLLTRHWIRPRLRLARDLDFLATFERDVDYVTDVLQRAVAVPIDDGLQFELSPNAVDEFWGYGYGGEPGIRAILSCYPTAIDPDDFPEYRHVVQIDIGFGDTLHPVAEWIDYPCLLPETTVRVPAVRPELQTAWKLQGLFEWEDWEDMWRPKDLWDAYLLTEHVPMDLQTFRECVEVAFADRETSMDLLNRLIDGDFGADLNGIIRWNDLREELRDPSIPETLETIVYQIGQRLQLAFGER